MRPGPPLFALLAASTLLFLAPGAFAKDRWLHLAVDEHGGFGDQVRITLPFDLVEALVPLIHLGAHHRCRVRIDGLTCDAADLRAVWRAVRARREGEFVTVESSDGTVRVAREGGHVVLRSREGRGRGSRVDARIPVPIIDALLSGDEEKLDIPAAIRAMGRRGAGDLVVVNDEETTVRIWVDGKRSSD